MRSTFIRSVAVFCVLVFSVAVSSVYLAPAASAFGGKNGGGFGGGKGGGGFGAGKGGGGGSPGAGSGSPGGGKKNWDDPAAMYFPGYDDNGDGHLDVSEWKRRGNFERLDANGNGTIEVDELRILYGAWGKMGQMENPIMPSGTPEMDPSILRDRISADEIDRRDVCGVVRVGVMGMYPCPNGDQIATELGLFETGIGPTFPKDAFCHGIDEIYALDYTDKTGKGMHGGIDLPTSFGTPMLAVAAGTIVGKFDPDINARGRTVVIRHSPDDTGLPFWVYTEYAHMDALPTQAVGQRVRMGEVLGPTGNSGLSKGNKSGKTRRRPGIHFAVYYSDSPRFAEVPNYIVPEHVRWMDSNAFYRLTAPYDTTALRDLPDAEKGVPIPIMFLDGAVSPAGTKRIWPYACKRE